MKQKVFLTFSLLFLATLIGLRFPGVPDSSSENNSSLPREAGKDIKKAGGRQTESLSALAQRSKPARSAIKSSIDPPKYDIEVSADGTTQLLVQPPAGEAESQPRVLAVLPPGVQAGDVEVSEEGGVVRVVRPQPGIAESEPPPLTAWPPTQ